MFPRRTRPERRLGHSQTGEFVVKRVFLRAPIPFQSSRLNWTSKTANGLSRPRLGLNGAGQGGPDQPVESKWARPGPDQPVEISQDSPMRRGDPALTRGSDHSGGLIEI